MVDLPFDFQYYGEVFDEITVCTNGFIAMGEQENFVPNFQNWPLDGGGFGGGYGMIAPLWDNLTLGGGGDPGIYTYYDDEIGMFIIEYYDVHYANNNADLRFQIQLFDPAVWANATGDGKIILQYHTVSMHRGQLPNYASVGITSPGNSTGIAYCSMNEYPPTNAELEDGRAILFTTSPRNITGRLYGQVTDHETGEPVEDATVYTAFGQVAITDENGEWEIPDALALAFTITAHKQGYNDSTLAGELEEDEEIEINFSLLHPEFTPSNERLGAFLNVDDEAELDFSVENTGNGPLDWRVERELRGDANADPWEIRRQYDIGETVDDSRIQGAVYVDGVFYAAGANDHNPTIYTFNDEGDLIDQFAQPGDDRYGFRDLAWDGEWIWGSGDNIVYALTPEGEVARQFEGPYNPNNNLAWDTDREVMWISSTTSDISSIDREGNVISELDRMDFRIYGLAYYSEDPDGYPLYIFHKDRDIADQIIHKMNPENNDTMFVTTLEPDGGGSPIGAFVTNQFDVYSYVFLAVTNDGSNDRIDIWQIDARKDWMAVEPTRGAINPGVTQDFDVTLSSEGLPPVEFIGDLVFSHNAAGGETRIELALDVRDGPPEPEPRELDLDDGWSMISLNVTPEENDIRAMMRPMVEEDVLRLLKDGEGRFYYPDHDFCNIPEWSVEDGYQINLSEPFVWVVEGVPVNPVDTLQLTEGWNLKSYYPRDPVDAIAALANLREELLIAKDWMGRFYLPAHNFSNMGDLVELQGYQIKVREDVELIYNIFDNRDRLAAKNPGAVDPAETHYPRVIPTGSNMSLLLKGDPELDGCEAAAYAPGGEIAGTGWFDAKGNCGMAVWGDDLTSDELDGLSEGESFAVKVWNGRREFPADVELKSGELSYTAGAIAVGAIKVNMIPTEFAITGIYPNPFNAVTRINFDVPELGGVNLSIYDLGGREIARLIDGDLKAGCHVQTWNAAQAASGMYFARMTWNGEVKMAKIIMIK